MPLPDTVPSFPYFLFSSPFFWKGPTGFTGILPVCTGGFIMVFMMLHRCAIAITLLTMIRLPN